MSVIPQTELEKINQDVYDKGFIDREHLTEFLTLIPTNDAATIIKEVKGWLQELHDDPKYNKIQFAQGEIDAVLGDLDSYGRVQPQTILEFKQSSVKAPPQS